MGDNIFFGRAFSRTKCQTFCDQFSSRLHFSRSVMFLDLWQVS
jgi:hypothetical protein